jgi:vancomycin permeability regulator SanA
MTRRRKLLLGAGAVGAFALLVAAPSLIVRLDTRSDRATDPASLPHKQVAIVLGAGIRGDGRPTLFLRDRLNGAIQLYRLGKVDGLLMTGDNHVATYDEATSMRDYAVAQGVPASAITLDYAGFDTYDSCYRARAVFGVQSAIVVTQSYHLPRAVYTCRGVGIDAVGLGVPDWGTNPTGQMAHYQVREMLASVKAMWDVDLGHPDPRFLGPHVQLNLHPVDGA